MNMLKTSFLVIKLFLSYLCVAQNFSNGYMIDQKRDTVKGLLRISKDYQEVQIKVGSKNVIYSSEDVSLIILESGKTYSTSIKPKHFVEYLVTGPISLYKLQDFFLVKKGTDSLITLAETSEVIVTENGRFFKKSTRWKNLLKLLASDCPNESKTIEQLRFLEKNIVEYVQDYNRCTGSNSVVYKSTFPDFKINGGFSLGIVPSNLSVVGFANSSLNQNYKSTDLEFGAAINIRMPKISNFITLQTGVSFIKSRYNSITDIDNAGDLGTYESTVDLSFIQIPFMIKPYLSFPQPSIYFILGQSTSFNLTREQSFVFTNSSTLEEQVGELFEIRKVGFSLFIGLGYERKVGKFLYAIDFRYQKFPNMYTTTAISGDLDRYSINFMVSDLF